MPLITTRGAMSARGFGFAANLPRVVQYDDFASSSSSTIDITAYTANGTLCVLADTASNSTGSSITKVVPSGFTEVASLSTVGGGVGLIHTVSYKVLNGTETTLTGQNSSTNRKVAVFFAFTEGLITSATKSASVGSQIVNSSLLTQQSISTSGQSAPTVLFGTFGTNVINNLTGLNPKDGELPVSAERCRVFYKLVNSGTQSAVMDGPTVSSTAAMTSFFITLS